ncbi:DNA-directed RNA polymerase subunit alpha C-terminal domain-containing protein [Comamonas humi]
MINTLSTPLIPLPGKLSKRTYNSLARNGFITVQQVIKAYPHNLLRIHGFGLAALREVERAFLPGSCYIPKYIKGKIITEPMLQQLYFRTPRKHNEASADN